MAEEFKHICVLGLMLFLTFLLDANLVAAQNGIVVQNGVKIHCLNNGYVDNIVLYRSLTGTREHFST